MVSKSDKPEDVMPKLRQVEVPQAHCMAIADAVRQNGVTVKSCYCWRRQYGDMSRHQLIRLKELVADNQRLLRAVSDLTLDKMILTKATL
jgi:putative transposase